MFYASHVCQTLVWDTETGRDNGWDTDGFCGPWNNCSPLKSLAFWLGAAAPPSRFPALFSLFPFLIELFNDQQGTLFELQSLFQEKHASPLEEIKNPIKQEMQLDRFGTSKAITI